MHRHITLLTVSGILVSCGGSPKQETKIEMIAPPNEIISHPQSQNNATSSQATAISGNPSTALTPRDMFFGNPQRASAQLSPNGKYISYRAPLDGVMNVWIGSSDQLDAAKPVTADKKRPVRQYRWAYTNKHIIYVQDTAGDENWHVFSVNIDTGKALDLTPFDGVKGQILGFSPRKPDTIVVGVNQRNPQFHDLYLVNIRTGKSKLLLENDGKIGYAIDDNYRVRMAFAMTPDGGQSIFRAGKKPGQWQEFMTIPQEDSLTTTFAGFDKSGKRGYFWDSRDRNTSGLFLVNLTNGKKKLIAADERADGSDLYLHPTRKTVEAVAFTYERKEWQILDKSIQPDIDALAKLHDVEFEVASSTLDNKTWLVAFHGDTFSPKYYLWNRKTQQAKFLFSVKPELDKVTLAKMHTQVIPSRDGLNLVSYYTVPTQSDPDGDGQPDQAQPTVLLVHGGPWARDNWGLNAYHQFLASRGYAVLSVNFRASTGFGKAFTNAGDKQWGLAMQNDLLDAVTWAVERGITNKSKVCIMGGSYGGYATLAALTGTPETFACGIDIVGPSNIITLINSIPPYWTPMIKMFTTRIGDPSTEDGKVFLTQQSPLTHVDKIVRPLLIGQGANDPRVKQSESDQIVVAMQERNIPVTYALFPDEGHGFSRPDNNMAFWALAEAFLSAHIGGLYQPTTDTDFSASTLQIPAGRDGIPGLPAGVGAVSSTQPAQ